MMMLKVMKSVFWWWISPLKFSSLRYKNRRADSESHPAPLANLTNITFNYLLSFIMLHQQGSIYPLIPNECDGNPGIWWPQDQASLKFISWYAVLAKDA